MKKFAALYDLRQIDREKSADYLARAHDYVSDVEPRQKVLSPTEQKRLLNLVFRNIKISDKKLKMQNFCAI